MTSARRTPADGLFHLPSGVYLLSHSVGCLPREARGSLEAALFAPWAEAGSDAWPAWLNAIAAFREALARLLGGQAVDWCPQPSVSAGVFQLIAALPQGPRRTLLISRHAFPSVGYALTGLEKAGFRVRFVEGNPVDPSAWREAMTDDVAAAVFMHVHSNSGLVSPVRELAEIAREKSIFTIADVCQSAGIVPLDVVDLGVDAVAGSCVKWLCGGPGAGFLWVDPEAGERLFPLQRGWFSHADPFEFDIGRFRYASGALRFWGGTPTIAPYAVATTGILAAQRTGVERVWSHNRALIDILRAELDPARASGIVTQGRGGTLCLDFGDAAASEQARLAGAGFHVDRRGSAIRMSFHVYNTEDDARALAAALRVAPPQSFRAVTVDDRAS